MNKELKKNWLPKLQKRYGRRNRQGKTRMLDELYAAYQYERKHSIKLLSWGLAPAAGKIHPGPERRYDEIEAALQYIWPKTEQPPGSKRSELFSQDCGQPAIRQ